MTDFCVCAEPIEERGLYPCGHALCLTCTLKKRTLMKDNQCPYCRATAKQVAVVANGNTASSEAHIDFNPGSLKVENKSLVRKLRHILDYPCPECDQEQKNYKTLKTHVHDEHGKALCDVCTKHEFNFSDEYQLFEPTKIKEHLKKQHVFCKYCRVYFYGITEFSKHCKQNHMGCGICERRDPEHPLYFKTYDQLYEHYKDKHYMCMVPTCLENKHIVFATVLELKRHMMEAHRGLIGNPRQAQKIDLDQLSRDAEEAQSAGSLESTMSETEADKARYDARLEIAAGHDSDKINKLRAANNTFKKKKVPVEIFIATYESVLSDSTAAEITALLSAFKRANSSSLSQEASRALVFQLNMRSQAERKEEEQQQKQKSSGTSPAPGGAIKTSAKPAGDAQSSRGPSKTPVATLPWGFDAPAPSGIGDISSLPKLGGKPTIFTGGQAQRPSSSSWASDKSRPAASSLGNLPTLAKKKNPFQAPNANPLSIRQTSIPMRDSRSNSDYFNSLRSSASRNTLPSLQPDSHPNSRSESPISSASLSPSSSSSSSSLRGVKSSESRSNSQSIQLSSLPRLPKQQQQTEKKRQRNVVRIV